MGNCFNFLDDGLRVFGYLFVFLIWNQSFLEPQIVSCDPSRARILVAFQRLDASKAKHKAPCRRHKISARGHGPSDIARIDQLATGNKANAIFQSGSIP